MTALHDAAEGAERAAAERLAPAGRERTPCAPVRDLIAPDDVAAAYRVQAANLADRYVAGRIRIGRKIGLTSPAVQQQLGVDRPDFGALLDDMLVDGSAVSTASLLQPKIEAEVAFVIGRDLDGDLDGVSALEGALLGAYAALEIVDSRVAGWDISLADTIADNASSGMFVHSPQRVDIQDLDTPAISMQMTVNGVERSIGTGAACLGDPLNALLWLARVSAELDDPLRAGEIILSGALGPMVTVAAGDVVVAELSGLGTVRAVFVAG